MVDVIVAKGKIDCEHLLGHFLDESHYDVLVIKDTDCYLPSNFDGVDHNESRIAFKFRKNFFTKEEQEQAYIGLREAATVSQNRGLAAGPKGEKSGNREWVTEAQFRTLKSLQSINVIPGFSLKETLHQTIQEINSIYEDKGSTRGLVWLSSETKSHEFKYEIWLNNLTETAVTVEDIRDQSLWVESSFISDTSYANSVNSGIAGWFDRYPRIPYGRATSYTQHHYEKFEKSFPFLQTLNKGFKELLPTRWRAQREAANKIDSRFLVPKTVFTTITVNKTFRTAAHRDAGDFSDGLSNLLVLSNDDRFTGGYLIFPEYRVAIDVRPGDLLLVNNHEIIHGNTPIVCGEGSERISLVCYLREKMLELGSYEYENLRYTFVESRRKNKEHPEWHERWNGISGNMWESGEWYDYLQHNGGIDMLNKYHPRANEKISSLEDLFS